jgi:predicted phosphodiesterase
VPNYDWRKGVLYFNPGSCGPRRFDLPVTVGVLKVDKDGVFTPKIIHLDPGTDTERRR